MSNPTPAVFLRNTYDSNDSSNSCRCTGSKMSTVGFVAVLIRDHFTVQVIMYVWVGCWGAAVVFIHGQKGNSRRDD